jgi:hypothetical protein
LSLVTLLELLWLEQGVCQIEKQRQSDEPANDVFDVHNLLSRRARRLAFPDSLYSLANAKAAYTMNIARAMLPGFASSESIKIAC